MNNKELLKGDVGRLECPIRWVGKIEDNHDKNVITIYYCQICNKGYKKLGWLLHHKRKLKHLAPDEIANGDLTGWYMLRGVP